MAARLTDMETEAKEVNTLSLTQSQHPAGQDGVWGPAWTTVHPPSCSAQHSDPQGVSRLIWHTAGTQRMSGGSEQGGEETDDRV